MRRRCKFPFVVMPITFLALLWSNLAAATTAPLSSFIVMWGDQPDQLGLSTGLEQENVGPLTFAVSPQGELYVADTVHRQIKRWQPDGTFQGVVVDGVRPTAMRFDSDGLLLLRTENGAEVYGPGGQRMFDVSVPREVPLVEGVGQDVWDEDGLLCMNDPDETVYCFEMGNARPTTATRVLAGRPAGKGRRILVYRGEKGIQAKQLTPSESNAPAPVVAAKRVGEIVMNATSARRFSNAQVGAVLFRGFLANQNLLIFETEEIVGRDVHLLLKGVRDGKVVTSLELPNESYTTIYKKVEVAPDGTVWQMMPTKDGVKFLRWELAP